MTHHRDAKSIEENLEHKRAQLGTTLDELQDRFSVERLAEDALGLIRTNAASYTRSIDRAVRANPMALALTGVGLAWLIFGSGRGQDEDGSDDVDRTFSGPGETSRAHGGGAGEHGWADRIDELRERASAMLRRLEEDARARVDAIGDYAGERTRILADFTQEMRHSLAEGLDGLSETAREEIMRARRKAYAARLRLGKSARSAGHEVERLVSDHPMIAGVVAMGLGAAFAAALPRTRIEDRTFGAESDRLMASAADMLRAERDRLERVARGVAEEARASAEEAKDALKARAADFAESVTERAATEAEN